MKVVINKDDIIEGKTDDRGRLCLGAKHANKDIEVAVLDESDKDE